MAVNGRELVTLTHLDDFAWREVLGAKAAILRTAETTGDRVLRPVVRIKRAAIADRYRQVRVDFRGGFSLILRATT